ncbi:MAG: fibronectin type III domain-containing protein, partial [Pedosphaera parvula]|nr:fibronectin type III domain-containing protein [Pedosphaera parvula]
MSNPDNSRPARARRGFPSLLAAALGAFLASNAIAAQFTLSWSDNSANEAGFRIERSLDGVNFAEVATVGANTVSYVDAGLPNATTYSYRLRAYNTAGNSGYSNVATGTTPPVASNSAPTISNIANQSINAGSGTNALAFTVGDAETSAGSLTVTASSSNPALVSSAGLTLGGSGSSRTLVFTPATGTSGTATITVRVSDGALSSTDAFVVTVPAENTAPTITSIPTQTIALNGTTSALAFTIGDAETAATALTLSTSSSNLGLIPLGNITLAGSGSSRTITVRPLTNTTGSSTIGITVSDGTLTRTTSFTVNVSPTLTYGDIGAPRI